MKIFLRLFSSLLFILSFDAFALEKGKWNFVKTDRILRNEKEWANLYLLVVNIRFYHLRKEQKTEQSLHLLRTKFLLFTRIT